MFSIRQYHPSDLTRLYRICLETGDSGEDATALYDDPDLLGHLYAAPYAVLEPELCFVLTKDGTPVGYVLGAQDSALFRERCEREWFPPLRERYRLPAETDRSRDASMIRAIYRGVQGGEDFPDYPAHLHIDLLPSGQGSGQGRAMMERFLERLREIGVPGVHLGVGAKNTRAIGFYQRMGFEKLSTTDGAIWYGMKFDR